MTFEERLHEIAKGQQRASQTPSTTSSKSRPARPKPRPKTDNAISQLVQPQTKNELLTQVIEALARLANTAAAPEVRIERPEER